LTTGSQGGAFCEVPPYLNKVCVCRWTGTRPADAPGMCFFLKKDAAAKAPESKFNTKVSARPALSSEVGTAQKVSSQDFYQKAHARI